MVNKMVNNLYRIVIWCWNTIQDTYESKILQDALDWFLNNWLGVWESGGCAFYVYRDGHELSFDEAYDLGFYG